MAEVVAVASQVHNLAGEESKRPDFLKSLVIGAVMQDADSLTEVINTGYRNGPGMRIKRFANWAKSNEEFLAAIGTTSGDFSFQGDIDLVALAGLLPPVSGGSNQIDFAEIGPANLAHWARQWVLLNEPTLLDTEWTSDYDEDTNLVTITWDDATTDSFTPADFDVTARYLYVGYSSRVGTTVGSQEILIYKQDSGTPALDALFAASTEAGGFYPPIPFRANNKPITDKPNVWQIRFPFPVSLAHIFHFARSSSSTDDFRKGIIISNSSAYAEVRDYDGDSLADVLTDATAPVFQHETASTWGTLDESDVIPTTPELVDLYPICKKAFEKAIGADYDTVQDSINSNPSILDLDYVQTVFGVSLNVEENACRKYIYKFLQRLLASTPTTGVTANEWWAEWLTAHETQKAWEAWYQRDLEGVPASDNPEPERIPYPTVPWNRLEVSSKRPGVIDYRTSLGWAFISEETGTGILKTGVKPGEVWLKVKSDPIPDPGSVPANHRTDIEAMNSKVTVYYQETKNTWRRMTVHGFHHDNYIYKNKRVRTTAKQALEVTDSTDPDYKESPFIIPLHEEVYEAMSLIDRTQMATACCFLVINCYKAREQAWYETGWFKVLFIVVIIAAAITLAIVTGGASLGLLGSASTVGGTLGATGTTAIILGAAVNALAGIALAAVLSEVATLLFGEKWGAVIGAVAAFMLTAGIGVGFDPGKALELFTSPEGLISVSMATGDATSTYLEYSLAELNEERLQMLEKSSRELAELQKKYDEEFSSWKRIDPANVSQYISELTEKPEAFLARTLLTGSDIVALNLEFLHNFTEHTLKMRLP